VEGSDLRGDTAAHCRGVNVLDHRVHKYTRIHTRTHMYVRRHAHVYMKRPPRLLFSITIGYQACRSHVAAASMTSAFARNHRELLPLSISQLVNATSRYKTILK